MAGADEGTPFGKYRIARKLGEGAFGSVFEAVLPGPMGFSRRVAIEQLRPALVRETPRLVRSLINEARIGGLLHHPDIVSIVEFDQVGEQFSTWSLHWSCGWSALLEPSTMDTCGIDTDLIPSDPWGSMVLEHLGS